MECQSFRVLDGQNVSCRSGFDIHMRMRKCGERLSSPPPSYAAFLAFAIGFASTFCGSLALAFAENSCFTLRAIASVSTL